MGLEAKERHKRATAAVFGVLLIGLGVMFLLQNFGLVDAGRPDQWWPLIVDRFRRVVGRRTEGRGRRLGGSGRARGRRILSPAELRRHRLAVPGHLARFPGARGHLPDRPIRRRAPPERAAGTERISRKRGAAMNATSSPASRIDGRLVAGALLILFGVLFTLDNMGVLDAGDVLTWWPVILIALGLFKVLRPAHEGERRSATSCWRSEPSSSSRFSA